MVLELLKKMLGGGARRVALHASPEARRLVDVYVAAQMARGGWAYERPSKLDAGRAVLESAPALQVEVLLTLFADAQHEERTGGNSYDGQRMIRMGARAALMSQLLQRSPPLGAQQLEWLVHCVSGSRFSRSMSLPIKPVVNALEAFVQAGGTPTARTLQDVEAFRTQLADSGENNADSRRLLQQLGALLGMQAPQRPLLEPGEAWAETALALLAQPGAREPWGALLRHAATAETAHPSRRWLQEARQHLDTLERHEAEATVEHWLRMAAEPGPADRRPFSEHNEAVLKGLVWTATLLDAGRIGPALRELGSMSFRKIPGVGARSVKVGNACLWALGALPGSEGVARLGQLRLAVKYPSARKLIDRALAQAAERAGMGPDELSDLAVPTFGLDRDGSLHQRLGEATALVELSAAGEVRLAWETAAGVRQAAVPAVVKREHAGALKELKRLCKDAQQMLDAQAARLEGALLSERVWDYATWRERCLEHPLVSRVARRLIWDVRQGERAERVLWDGETLAGLDGRRLEVGPEGAQVRLWHPLEASAREVLAWRSHLVERGLTQPFKQAHREVYLLTDAERTTRTYSNRFAAHILRQHQLAALCQQRGWRYRLQGAFDGHNNPTLLLPQHDLQVELWVEGGAGEMPTSGAGISLYVPTDQVRFVRGGSPLPLEEVAPRVFSEAMRDVDLFVGVASIGNDPSWRDRGEARGYDAYWQSYAFGELAPSAQTRREVLAQLLPRLRIRDRLRLEERFLAVRGDVRSYRIHLGSGNILMQPDDQYLCIVQDGSRRTGDPVRLPFEGDHTLSLILSKAFLLAADAAIKDPTILRQLAPRS